MGLPSALIKSFSSAAAGAVSRPSKACTCSGRGAVCATSVARLLRRRNADAVPAGARFVHDDMVAAAPGLLGGGSFDGVLHFAAKSLVGESVVAPELYWFGNVVKTLQLLEAIRVSGTPRLVFSSTAATYGEPESVPITEDAPTRPTNAYGATKLAIDNAITSTISRTIITHGCTQLMVLSMLLFGGATLHYFALALTIGILFGIYSSVFVAAAIAMWLGIQREDLIKAPVKKDDGDPADPNAGATV